jgi:hypothetical protein
MSVRPRLSTLRALACGALLVTVTTGCLYGFAGGGFPPGIKTVAVLPFDNQTPEPALQRELFDALRRGLQDRLNLREAAEARAHAVVRGTIVKYEVDVPIGFGADPRQANSARRRLQLVLDIEIVEQATGRVLWEKKGLTATGEYAERDEAGGRRQAIDKAITDVVEGAQSQW